MFGVDFQREGLMYWNVAAFLTLVSKHSGAVRLGNQGSSTPDVQHVGFPGPWKNQHRSRTPKSESL